jgi:GxxExxY protein
MSELLEKELVYQIVGCAIAVINDIGHGLREKTYENALCIEFDHQAIRYNQQLNFPVYYRNKIIDEFVPNLVVENRIIVEIKTIEALDNEHRGQLINYLRISGKKVGLLLNFKHPKLQWERLVLEEKDEQNRQTSN